MLDSSYFGIKRRVVERSLALYYRSLKEWQSNKESDKLARRAVHRDLSPSKKILEHLFDLYINTVLSYREC